MDITEARKQLHQLQTWRNQLVGLGLIPPDVSKLLENLEEVESRISSLTSQRDALANSVDGLAAEFDQKRTIGEKRLKEGHEAARDSLSRQLDGLRNEILDKEKAAVRTTKALNEVEERASKRIPELNNEIAALEERLSTLKEEFDEFKKTHGLQ